VLQALVAMEEVLAPLEARPHGGELAAPTARRSTGWTSGCRTPATS